MTSHIRKPKPVITYSENLSLEGLEEQWQEGDPLALVEAVAICGKEGDPYPKWVSQALNRAMTELYDAVYTTGISTLPNGREISKNWMRDEKDLKWRLDRARDQFLIALGLFADRDNAGRIRNRLLRDAYLAELVAHRCEFVPNAKKPFKGVSPALDDLAEMLEPDKDQPDKLRRFPQECWGAKPDTIKRAWMKHKEKLVDCYANNPSGPIYSLDWLLGYSEPEPDPEPDFDPYLEPDPGPEPDHH